MELELTAELISSVLGVLLSLCLTYIPGLNVAWDNFTYKREVLGLAGVGVAAALVGLHFLGAITLVGFGTTFGWPTIIHFITVALAFLGGGQGTYTVTRDK